MKRLRHISWENFASTILIRGEKRIHRISASPLIELFSDGVSGKVGIWLQTDREEAIPPEALKLVFLAMRYLVREGGTTLEISTSSVTLRKQFYYFAIAVADRVLMDAMPAPDAAIAEMRFFAELLAASATLSLERQVGLLGELIFLERLLMSEGPEALDAWIGPSGEPHDFRIQNREFEIKTTTTAHRIHTINGSEQLVPSKGCALFLISVVLGPAGAGAGFTLPDKVRALEGRLKATSSRLRQFTSTVESCGVRPADYAQYCRRFALRRPLALVTVDEKFPALTRPAIQAAVGPLAERIESLEYSLNVEGLEFEEGQLEFSAVLPSPC